MQERIQVVDLRPGDLIIVSTDMFLNKEQRVHLQEHLKKKFPENEVVIVEGGMNLTVARPGANELMERIAEATEKLAKQFNEVSAGGRTLLTESAS